MASIPWLAKSPSIHMGTSLGLLELHQHHGRVGRGIPRKGDGSFDLVRVAPKLLYHFCHILLVKTSHAAIADSRVGKIDSAC